jgi:hypothetical protein
MKRILTLLAFAILAAPGLSPAAVLNDEVTSVKLKEADGTSGQNTNSGAGVKTGHIQNGAVTDAKIAGPISTSKLNVGTAAGTVAAGNHAHDAVYQKRVANVVVVAKSGGDFTDLASAMASITTASATNPYLIRIMPGTYTSAAAVIGKEWVTIEGAGQSSTKLVGPVSDALLYIVSYQEIRGLTMENTGWYGAVVGGSNVKLSDVAVKGFIGGLVVSGSTIRLDGVEVSEFSSGDEHFALRIVDAADVVIHGSVIRVDGPWYGNRAIALQTWSSSNISVDSSQILGVNGGSSVSALQTGSTNLRISDCYVRATGQFTNYALTTSAPTFVSNSTIIAEAGNNSTLGVWNQSPSLFIENSSVTGYPVAIESSIGSARVAHSRLEGSVTSGGVVKCLGTYDADLNPVSCQ